MNFQYYSYKNWNSKFYQLSREVHCKEINLFKCGLTGYIYIIQIS